MSSPPSSPFPFLPTEVKKEILKFCDQPTLAKTSSLSLEFLELSSPLLYRHIAFEGPEGLTKFLTVVAERRHPDLEPWLDLSLVHSITYDDFGGRPFVENWNECEPFARRLCAPSSPSPGRLPLQSLRISLQKDISTVGIYRFFNPVVLQLEGPPGGQAQVSFLDGFSLKGWDRLRELVFVHAFFRRFVLTCLRENREVGDGYRLIYDISADPGEQALLDCIEMDLKTNGWEEVARWVDSVVVSVGSEEQRTSLLRVVARSSLLPRLTVLVKASTETASSDLDTA